MTRRFLAGMLAAVLMAAVLPGRAGATFPAGSQIIRAELDGMVASVRYSAAEEAELVAAVYTEDGKELLASGRRTVSAAEDATADLRLTGTRPEYAQLRVFLLGREDHAPLCASYRTSAFVCPPEEIEETEPKDFEADRVLTIGSSGDFAAVKQGVVLLRAEENAAGENQLFARDDEAVQYKIGTPSETVRNLRAGQILALEYERGKLLMLRVRKLQVDEDAVTLYGDDSLQLSEVFDLIKLTASVPAEDFARENDGLNTREGKILLDEDGLTGETAVKIAAAVKILGAVEQQMQLEATPELSGTVTTDGAEEISIPLGNFDATPAEGVRVRFAPVLHLRTDAAQTVQWMMKGNTGFAYDSAAGQWEETGETPEIVITADQPGEAEVRVTWETELTLWESVLSLRMEQEWGGVLAVIQPEGHECLSGTRNASQKSKAVVAPLAMPWTGKSNVFVEKHLPEKILFRMPGNNAWSEGSCSETPSPPTEPEPDPSEPTPEPEEPGADTPAENPETPEQPNEPETPTTPEEPDTPAQPETPDENPEEPKEPETPEQPETPETPDPPQEPETPAEPSEPPAQKTYRLEDGVLYIEQAEQLADYDAAEQTPWYAEREQITEVRLCEGIDRIGNYAFAGCKNLRVVKILTPELTIGTGAFAGCEGLETVYYNKGTKTQWRSLVIGEGNEALQGAAIHCANGQIKPGGKIGQR